MKQITKLNEMSEFMSNLEEWEERIRREEFMKMAWRWMYKKLDIPEETMRKVLDLTEEDWKMLKRQYEFVNREMGVFKEEFEEETEALEQERIQVAVAKLKKSIPETERLTKENVMASFQELDEKEMISLYVDLIIRENNTANVNKEKDLEDN